MGDAVVDKSKIHTRYYNLKIILIDDGIREEVPARSIMNLSLENDYRNNLFPILRLQLVLSRNLHKIILENKNTIKIKVELDSFIRGDEDFLTGVSSGRLSHINDIFQPIMGDLNDISEDIIQDRTVDSSLDPNYYMDIYLFHIKSLDINKQVINFIAKDCKVKDAIGYIFKCANVEKVLMSIPDNNKIHPQLIVPPLNFKNSIKSISDNYGIYENGIRQFYDFDTYYLLPNTFKNLPLLSGEYNNVYINVIRQSASNSSKEGYYTDDKQKCYVVNTLNTINMISAGSANKELNGNIIKTYNREDLEKSVKYDKSTKRFKFDKGYYETELDVDGYKSGDKVSFVIDKSQNNTRINSFKTQVKQSNTEFMMSFNTINLQIFKLNRIFIFRFEEIKFANQYNGRYMLESLSFVMEEQKGEIQALCKFRKVD